MTFLKSVGNIVKEQSKKACCFIFRVSYPKKLCLLSTLLLVIFMQFFLHHLQKDIYVRKEPGKCWETFFTDNESGAKRNFIPSSVKEFPEDEPPAIPTTFLLEEKDYCRNRPELKMIAYVHSAISAVAKRQETRQTWGSASHYLGVVFMVGRAKSKEEENIVKHESTVYRDIVQGDYTDLYELLTYKALNALHWLTKNCYNISWVLHSDDDCIIDVYKLMPLLDELGKAEGDNTIFCHIYMNARSRRYGKWMVSLSEYHCDFYPSYCAGPFWFGKFDTAKLLVDTAPKVKFLWVDDVYVTGLVVEKSGIKLETLDMGLFGMKPSDIGYKISWLEANMNRIKAWKKIVEYHAKEVASGNTSV